MSDLIPKTIHKLKTSLHYVNVRLEPVVRWFSEVYRSSEVWSWLLQILGALAVLIGISMWSVPSALIIGGLAAVAAVELQRKQAGEPQESPEETRKIRAVCDAALSRGVNPFADTIGVPFTTKWITYVALARRNADKS